MKNIYALTLMLSIVAVCKAQFTPDEIIKQLGRGINIGNTLDAPYEGNWRKPVQEYYFDDYKAAGFKTIRIPITWDKHTMTASPFTIDEAWMDRVEQIVDWGLQRDLFIIINAHHEQWLKDDYSNTNKARFDQIWTQISSRFKDKSDKLIFEMLNEPIGLTTTQVNDVNKRILKIIRANNPKRIVLYSGNDWSGFDPLKKAAILDDDYLIGYYHEYDPYLFAQKGEGTYDKWDLPDTKNKFNNVESWSKANQMHVVLGEWGSKVICEYNSRMLHYATYTELAVEHGVPFQAWDDGGNYEIYKRGSRKWTDLKDILIHTYKESPTLITSEVVQDTQVKLKWTNRTNANDSILIQRRQSNTEFATIDSVPFYMRSYIDETTADKGEYYYRLITTLNGVDRQDSIELYSYPTKIEILSDKYKIQRPYNGVAAAIPGTVEAEYFDDGNEGLSYHDSDDTNRFGVFRTEYSVDTESRSDGGYQVGNMETGEWLEYTVNVLNTGPYSIDCHMASMNGGGTFTLSFNGVETAPITVPKTNSWTTTDVVSVNVNLTQGEQILRFNVKSLPYYNFDKLVINNLNVSVGKGLAFEEYEIYPNPASDLIFIINSSNKPSIGQIIGLQGQLVKEFVLTDGENAFSVQDITPGIYLIKVANSETQEVHRIVIR